MKTIIDPKGKYPDVEHYRLQEGCGYLLPWAMEAKILHTEETPVTMKDRLLANYNFFMGEMTGGVLHPDGTYTYPEDPVMYPLIEVKFNDETLWIHQFGIVGILNADGTTFVTRMD